MANYITNTDLSPGEKHCPNYITQLYVKYGQNDSGVANEMCNWGIRLLDAGYVNQSYNILSYWITLLSPNQTKQKLQILRYIAASCFILSNVTAGESYFTAALDLCSTISMSPMYIYYERGTHRKNSGLYASAIESFQLALPYFITRYKAGSEQVLLIESTITYCQSQI